MDVMSTVARLQVRLRGVDAMRAVAAGSVALSGVTAAGAGLAGLPRAGTAAGLVVGMAIAAAGVRRAWRRWTPAAVASALETRVPGLDNLVVTAVDLCAAPGGATERMRAEVLRQADLRAATIVPGMVAPMRRPVMLVAAALTGAIAVVWAGLGSVGPGGPSRRVGPPATGITRLRVVVTPPAYLGDEAQAHEDPAQVEVPAGSAMRLQVSASTPLVWLQDASGTRMLARDAAGTFAAEWVPESTSTLVVAAGGSAGVAEDQRLLPVVVVPDRGPLVRIAAPGRDLAFGTPQRVVEIEVEAEDTEALLGLEVRFTRLSGSGETFSFAEGRVPLAVERLSSRRWTGRATWALSDLGLEDGDAVVYRAVAKDTNPTSDWASSESYTVEIGQRLEFASTGFALPDEDRRYAISQQMVIVKTERLEADRGRLSTDEWAEQTGLLAMEQRMVRAEVVFLSGGEVQDEVEEAAHAHELQEGRLENRGRAEMIRAITEMSRAEARLSAGDTAGALVYERSALEALQRAFDRRRYFLRTLPERARIDLSRRLSGERRAAASFVRPGVDGPPDALAGERALMAELAELAGSGRAATPLLVATFASVAPLSPEWQGAAAALAGADGPDARREAAVQAMNLVAARARAALAPPARGPLAGPAESLRGWWAEESRPRRVP